MAREIRRIKATPNGKEYFTEEEELLADEELAAWLAGPMIVTGKQNLHY